MGSPYQGEHVGRFQVPVKNAVDGQDHQHPALGN